MPPSPASDLQGELWPLLVLIWTYLALKDSLVSIMHKHAHTCTYIYIYKIIYRHLDIYIYIYLCSTVIALTTAWMKEQGQSLCTCQEIEHDAIWTTVKIWFATMRILESLYST